MKPRLQANTRNSDESTQTRKPISTRLISWFRVVVADPWRASAFGAVLITTALAAQTPPQAPLPKGQMPDLGRPTKSDDALPPFNFDEYFPGKWTFEWDVPEGPLGPAGRITGTTVYKPVDGRFYEANTEATGPGGAFKLRESI